MALGPQLDQVRLPQSKTNFSSLFCFAQKLPKPYEKYSSFQIYSSWLKCEVLLLKADTCSFFLSDTVTLKKPEFSTVRFQ